jgi:hypothetical protein
MTTCKSCGAVIEWITTASGKSMPCDPKLVRVMTKEGALVAGFIPHFATCPTVQQHRQARRGAEAR